MDYKISKVLQLLLKFYNYKKIAWTCTQDGQLHIHRVTYGILASTCIIQIVINMWGIAINLWGIVINMWGIVINMWGIVINMWGIAINMWELSSICGNCHQVCKI